MIRFGRTAVIKRRDMADIFVSYARSDQKIIRPVVDLLEAEGWSVWWDMRIVGGDRWDETIEREIAAARCVVVVWTPNSFDRQWVHLEAHHGHHRGILVPILIGVEKPPFAFGLVQARDLTGWDGMIRTAAAVQVLADVRRVLEGQKLDWEPVGRSRAEIIASLQACIRTQDRAPLWAFGPLYIVLGGLSFVAFIATLAFARTETDRPGMMTETLVSGVVWIGTAVLIPLLGYIEALKRRSAYKRIRECFMGAQPTPQETQAIEQWIKMSTWRFLNRDRLLSEIWKWSASSRHGR
jgi:hypothetical protein